MGHELGHYCLHKDRKEIRCSAEDIENLGGPPHGIDIEREANVFASNLLMPTSDIRGHVVNAKIFNLELAASLAARYHTSLTATACRLVEVSFKPCAIVMVDSCNRILWGWSNPHFHSFFAARGTKLNPVRLSYEGVTLTSQDQPTLCPSGWEITLSAVSLTAYAKTLLFIQGEFFGDMP
ncbi:ImmA/IrrE family metallo-endopeptidase [Marinobacter sp.]|uniref:ImmA/IrrE family metallo-endopeptidase n=1 Tax=Marinobacter sp. TaxID=50741 RepID=UPI00343B24E4